MDLPNIKYLLANLRLDISKTTITGNKAKTQWLTVRCPFAQWTHSDGYDGNPSFGITIAPERHSAYRCLSCGMKGRLSSLPSRLGGYRKTDESALRLWAERTELQSIASRPIPDWDSEESDIAEIAAAEKTFPNLQRYTEHPMAFGVPYLRKRGIGFAQVAQLGLRYDAPQKRVLFPVFDHHRVFRGFTGRSTMPSSAYSKGYPKVKDYYGLDKREIFLGLPRDGVGPNIISEGLFDYANGVKAGFTNARAVLGTAITPQKLDILKEDGKPVHLFFDNDLAGWQAMFGVPDDEGELNTSNAWAYQLYRELPVWIVPYPQTFNGMDPGSLSVDLYRKLVENAYMFHGEAPMNELEEPIMTKPTRTYSRRKKDLRKRR